VSVSLGGNSFAQKSKEKPNAEITKMLRDISAKNIETTIRSSSVSARATLCPSRTIRRAASARRAIIFREFQKISADCGNCLTVEKQTFLQPKANRIPEPTNLTNVIATLRGTTDPTRFYVVSGHYDSMCSSPD
jgi:hypothetical protein